MGQKAQFSTEKTFLDLLKPIFGRILEEFRLVKNRFVSVEGQGIFYHFRNLFFVNFEEQEGEKEFFVKKKITFKTFKRLFILFLFAKKNTKNDG